jgi:hypothetical protein
LLDCDVGAADLTTAGSGQNLSRVKIRQVIEAQTVARLQFDDDLRRRLVPCSSNASKLSGMQRRGDSGSACGTDDDCCLCRATVVHIDPSKNTRRVKGKFQRFRF